MSADSPNSDKTIGERALLRDLERIGFSLDTVWEWVNNQATPASAVPGLLDHFDRTRAIASASLDGLPEGRAMASIFGVSPTIFREGPYRFFFFSREETRVHVHVSSGDGEAKFWLSPEIELAETHGLPEREIAKLVIYSEP